MERLKKGRSRIALIAVVLGAALVAVVPAGAMGTYADKGGDGASAGDVTGVVVAADVASGQIIFRISGSNLSTSENNMTFVDIDTDANPFTGALLSDGADYFIGVDDSSYGVYRWTGAGWLFIPTKTTTVNGGGSGLMISVNKSELGNTSSFNFRVLTRNLANHEGDAAPDDGLFNFSLAAGGPDIQGVDVGTTPASGPRAGKAFTVTPTALKLPPDARMSPAPVVAESYTCRATLKGRAIVGTGMGGCTWKLPKKAKRSVLKVVLTVAYQGATKQVVLSWRVA